MNWVLIKRLFLYSPYLMLALSMLAYVWRCRLSRRAAVLWFVWLFACSSWPVCSLWVYGEVFQPRFPEVVIWLWGWAYIGSLLFGGLSLVTLPCRWRCKRWMLPILAWGISAVGVWNGVKVPSVHELTLAYPDLPDELDGYRIVQVSDIHASAGARRWRTEAIVKTVNALDADLVCLTGDYVDGKVDLRRTDIEPIRGLKAKDGVYCVTGNHEYYFSWKDWHDAYVKMGLRFLANECVFPRKSLALGGVNDVQVRRQRPKALPGAFPDVRATFAAATNGEFRILLQHQPKTARENIGECGVRLQLSGHSHGGIMPVMHWIVRRGNNGFERGLYEFGSGKLYVSCGAGQCAAFPIRYLAPSEISLITLKKGKER